MCHSGAVTQFVAPIGMGDWAPYSFLYSFGGDVTGRHIQLCTQNALTF